MSYRLCGRNEAQNSRSDPYADGTGKKLSVHKCQNLSILDQTLHSIRQGPAGASDVHVPFKFIDGDHAWPGGRTTTGGTK